MDVCEFEHLQSCNVGRMSSEIEQQHGSASYAATSYVLTY